MITQIETAFLDSLALQRVGRYAGAMDYGEAIVLALVQGFTEFLPISSSAHLVLVRALGGGVEDSAALAFDVAVHFGTLVAVVLWFRRELLAVATKGLGAPFSDSADARLLRGLLIGTVPVGAAALLAGDAVEDVRTPLVIMISTIVFGLVLWHSDRAGKRDRELGSLTLADVWAVGFAQVLALLPGTSRSGITITAALYRGMSRQAAARFSFLLSVPVIALASAKGVMDLMSEDLHVELGPLLVGVVVSAISAFTCIEFFMRLVGKVGLSPFVVYRLLLGVAIAVWLIVA
jgi:undecaprenyl-diphosphatase